MYALIIVKTLCFKNKIIQFSKKRKEFFVYLLVLFFPLLIFNASKEIFLELIKNPRFDLIILSKVVSSLLLALNLIVVIASIIASIGNLFTAKDLNLLKTLPISKNKIFTIKFINIYIESSWTIFLFLLPIIYSFGSTLNLSFSFYIISTLSILVLSMFSSSIGTFIACLAMNKFDPKKCLEIIVGLMSISLVYLMIYSNSPNIGSDENSAQEIITYFSTKKISLVTPHIFATDALASYWDNNSTFVSFWTLILISIASYIVAMFSYAFLPEKTHKVNHKIKIVSKIYKPLLKSKKIVFNSIHVAFFSKENKTILRDLNQSSQFLVLIFITFVYLLNFQHLKNKPSVDPEMIKLWYHLLAISNISLGSCILTAIATRFVFPSISMEGKCFELLRTAPISMYDILYYKFTTWLLPFCIVSLVILMAGAFAIDANISIIVITGFIAVNLSFALVATAIGTGAKYARFEWDTPNQVATGFGSLVLMFKSFFLVSIYIMLTSMCILSFNNNENIFACFFVILLTILISAILVRDNLISGSKSLEQQ